MTADNPVSDSCTREGVGASSREQIADVMARVQALRFADESACIIAVGSYAGDADCPDGSMTATVRVGMDEASGHAVHLHDALLIARGKVRAAIEARKREAAKRRDSGSDPKGEDTGTAAECGSIAERAEGIAQKDMSHD